MTSRSKSSPQVHQIKAIFEGYRNALSRPSDQNKRGNSYRSKSSTDVSDQNKERPDQELIAREPTNDLSNTIESIIDTQIPVLGISRPALSQKPSWVGPPQVNCLLYDPSMTRKVSIEYSATDLQPPVFVTTSLSSPPWEIIEMEAINHPEGQYLFKAEFDAMEGEYQYKFRLGPGDWWVCDESKPMMDDGIGNRNNILHVQGTNSVAESQMISHAQSSAPQEHDDRRSGRSILNDSVNDSTSLINLDATDRNTDEIAANATKDLLHTKSDTFAHNSTRSINVEVAEDDDDKYHDDQIQDQDAEDAAPLMRHETISPMPADSPIALTSPRSSASERSISGNPVSPEGDPNDPSLHHFPTHHAGILRELSRTRRHLPEDQGDGDIVIVSPTRTSSNAFSQGPTQLGTVKEDQDSEDMLLIIGEKEETLITPATTPKDEQHQERRSDMIKQDIEDEHLAVNHSHHHKYKHHHPPPAVEDMLEERSFNQQVLAQPAKCMLTDAQDS